MEYKITSKEDKEYFIEATAEEIKSPIFEKVWEAMEFKSVDKYVEDVDIEKDNEEIYE